jgi:hypothetical protein
MVSCAWRRASARPRRSCLPSVLTSREILHKLLRNERPVALVLIRKHLVADLADDRHDRSFVAEGICPIRSRDGAPARDWRPQCTEAATLTRTRANVA